MSAVNIQQLFDDPVNGVVELPAGEYEGSFFIRKSCTVKGSGTVLWSGAGPALVIDSEGVSLSGLRAELTSDGIGEAGKISILCRAEDVKFSGVEVNGAVPGIPGEEEYWGLPRILDLGRLPEERKQSFYFEVYVPVTSEISCNIYGVSLSCRRLEKGYSTVTLTVDNFRGGSIIYGDICVKSEVTGIIRKITVKGEICAGDVPEAEKYSLFSVDREAPYAYRKALSGLDLVYLATAGSTQERVELTPEERSVPKPEEYPDETVNIVTGRRVPLLPRNYRIEFLCGRKPGDIDIDPYLFLLSGGRVRDNSGLVFFGNKSSGGARYFEDGAIIIDFANIPGDIDHMTLLFSVYGGKAGQDFSLVNDGEVDFLCENGVKMRLKLENNINCPTILACGFERLDGVWELVPSGKGVAMELTYICKSYGVTVV